MISSGDNPCAANVDGVERSRLALHYVSLSQQRFDYLGLSYYCHIKIRTLHFVSNFQFSLYRMLARVRRLASVSSFCARVTVRRTFFLLTRTDLNIGVFVSYWLCVRDWLNGIHGVFQQPYGGPSSWVSTSRS